MVDTLPDRPLDSSPRVYLAHASEDHERLAKPLATRLMANGIEVWLDGWEIRSGDSLRRKMEVGLQGCTHFLVLLTPNSLGKPWVETEIDVGFVRSVEGASRFIGLRMGIEIGRLSPFLRTLRCPEVDLEDDAEIERLIADLHGVSTKPALGPKPQYVQPPQGNQGGWSRDAFEVAGYLVRNSKDGCAGDPRASVSLVADATGLPETDVRLGVLDLSDVGLIEKSRTIGSDQFWPKAGLFVEFDRHFLNLDTAADGVAVANRLVSEGIESANLDDEFLRLFQGWPIRRMNGALTYLEQNSAIELDRFIGSARWVGSRVRVTDRTRRFVRDRG